MLLDALNVSGLAGLEGWDVQDLDPVVLLPPPPLGVAIADALSLVQIALSRDRARRLLDRLQLARAATIVHEDSHGFVEQLTDLEPANVAALLQDGRERRIVVGARLRLDPQLYGRIREEAGRDPRVVTALGQDATLTIKVGWLFTRDLSAASVTVLEVRVGELSFPVHATDRRSWMTSLLTAVGERFGRPDPDEPLDRVASRLLATSLSAVPSERQAWRRLSSALATAPFSLGEVELVEVGGQPTIAFGPRLIRARQLGPAAGRALRLVAGALLDAPDVLIVDEPVEGPLREWLIARTSGADATLEQVVFVGAGQAEVEAGDDAPVVGVRTAETLSSAAPPAAVPDALPDGVTPMRRGRRGPGERS